MREFIGIYAIFYMTLAIEKVMRKRYEI